MDGQSRPITHEYLSQLHTDNASLQRRLNLVLAELDRINREKSALAQKLQLADQDVEQYQGLLEDQTQHDKTNRELQLDLTKDRENNNALKF